MALDGGLNEKAEEEKELYEDLQGSSWSVSVIWMARLEVYRLRCLR